MTQSAAEYTDSFSEEGLDSSNECPGYETQQSDDEDQVMLELWGIRSTPSCPSLQDPLKPVAVAPKRALYMGQIKLNSVVILRWIV